MNLNIIKSKELTKFVLIFYFFYGISFMLLNYNLDISYLSLSFFMIFKMIFNYNKCTLSYLECKIRDVNKEEGYLYVFLKNLVDLRYSNLFPIILLYFVIINIYFFKIKKQTFKFF